MDIDAAGRIWVAEGVNYRRANGDQITVLQGTSGDGKVNSSHAYVREKGHPQGKSDHHHLDRWLDPDGSCQANQGSGETRQSPVLNADQLGLPAQDAADLAERLKTY